MQCVSCSLFVSNRVYQRLSFLYPLLRSAFLYFCLAVSNSDSFDELIVSLMLIDIWQLVQYISRIVFRSVDILQLAFSMLDTSEEIDRSCIDCNFDVKTNIFKVNELKSEERKVLSSVPHGSVIVPYCLYCTSMIFQKLSDQFFPFFADQTSENGDNKSP